MLDLILTILFLWLGFKALKLAFKVAWGTAKLIASILLVLALPALVGCLLFAGGILLLIPVALVAVAFTLLSNCI